MAGPWSRRCWPWLLNLVSIWIDHRSLMVKLWFTLGFWINPWAKFLYGSAVLFFCLVVCLIGAGMFTQKLSKLLEVFLHASEFCFLLAGLFAKTSFVIFLLVIMSVICSLVSAMNDNQIISHHNFHVYNHILHVLFYQVSFLLHYDKEIPFPDDNPLKTRFHVSYINYTQGLRH